MNNTGISIVLLLLMVVLLTSCENKDIKQNVGDNPIKNITNATEINLTATEPKKISIEPPEFYLPRKGNLSVYVMDIDGESIILQHDDDSILINSGYETDSKTILNTLRKLGIDELDIIIATNTQPKNMGGLPYIMLRSEANTLYDNGFPSISYSDIDLLFPNLTKRVTIDQAIKLNDILIRFIVPYDDGKGFSLVPYENSIVTKVSFGTVDFLFMSDCGEECEERIYPYPNMYADVIKISGDCNANTFSLIQKVKPSLAIFSSNGTLCEEAYNRYDYINVPVYQTKEKGDIFITTDGYEYTYYTQS